MLLSFQQSVCLKKHWLRSYVFFKKLDIPKIIRLKNTVLILTQTYKQKLVKGRLNKKMKNKVEEKSCINSRVNW